MVAFEVPCEPDGRRPGARAAGAEGTRAIRRAGARARGYAVRPGAGSTKTASVIQQPANGAFDCRER